MLVVTRKRGEKVFIGPDISVFVTKVLPNGAVRLAISAPPNVPIAREELLAAQKPEAPK